MVLPVVQYFDVVAFEVEEAHQQTRGQRGGAAPRDTSPQPGSAAAAKQSPRMLRVGVVVDTLPTTPDPLFPSSASPLPRLTVAPLRKAPDWAESNLWIEEDEGGDDANIEVGLERVVAVLTGALLSQRQDAQHNPHGEHAHDVWELPLAGVEWAGGGGDDDDDGAARERLAGLLLLPPPPPRDGDE